MCLTQPTTKTRWNKRRREETEMSYILMVCARTALKPLRNELNYGLEMNRIKFLYQPNNYCYHCGPQAENFDDDKVERARL